MNQFDAALQHITDEVNQFISSNPCEIAATWPVSQRCMSEAGGRLIEDFLAIGLCGQSSEFLRPASSRSIADIIVKLGALQILVDVKCANVSPEFGGSAPDKSRPNLASIRKRIEFYGDAANELRDVAILLLKYRMRVSGRVGRFQCRLDIEPVSSGGSLLFFLRTLSEANMFPARIGSGGQILLARGSRLKLVERSREKFLDLLTSYSQRLRTSEQPHVLARPESSGDALMRADRGQSDR